MFTKSAGLIAIIVVGLEVWILVRIRIHKNYWFDQQLVDITVINEHYCDSVVVHYVYSFHYKSIIMSSCIGMYLQVDGWR